MLYVFHVDVGRMLSFDMTVALSSVENLKETIHRLHGIPAANIVLLVSGGEMLTHSTQVSCYSAGTDTNPIYMFLTGDERLAPTIASGGSNEVPDAELRRQVEESHKLPAVLDTVRQRAQLAQHMRELGPPPPHCTIVALTMFISPLQAQTQRHKVNIESCSTAKHKET